MTALATAGNQENPLLELGFIFMQTRLVSDLFELFMSCTIPFSLVSVLSELFSHLVIFSLVCQCILSHCIKGICPRL